MTQKKTEKSARVAIEGGEGALTKKGKVDRAGFL